MSFVERLKWVFLGQGGVRGGWRFAVFAGLYYWLSFSDYGVFPLVAKVYAFSASGYTPGDDLVSSFCDGLLVLLISLLLVRLEKRRGSWFGLAFERGMTGLFASGWLWGFAIVTLLLLIASVGGGVGIDGFAEHGATLWKYLVLWLGAMLCVGLNEELLFRGYPLAALTRGISFWPGAVILSILFGAAHLFTKPMETVPDILNIVLLGLFCCYTVRRTGSLWFVIGFHASFDFFALGFYGSPNTINNGLPLEHHLLDTHISGPAWLTGGPQGLEASWPAPLLTLAMFMLFRRLYPESRYPRD
jgi:uncharacterized protein